MFGDTKLAHNKVSGIFLVMTGTLHCHLGESCLHTGDSLSLDVKPAKLQGRSILSSIRKHI